MTWIVPVQEGKTHYTVDDIIRKEFTTKSVTAGGNLKLTLGDVVAGNTTISVPVESNGAAMIYYTYLSNTAGKRLADAAVDNESRANAQSRSRRCGPSCASGRPTAAAGSEPQKSPHR